jgi:hypothetical protein
VFTLTSQARRAARPTRERRSHVRLAFDCPARWNDGSADRCGTTRDVSDAGAGFTVRALCAPAVGQQIKLIFELDAEREWLVDEKARVVRCDARDDGLFDVGVELRPI